MTPTLNMRDQILQQHVPTVMVPRFGELTPMTKPGHRYLVAADGLYIEVLRPWLHCRWPVGEDECRLPYGSVVPFIQGFDAVRTATLVQQFVAVAEKRLPNECGAWIIGQCKGKGTVDMSLLHLEAIEASPGKLKYRRPDLGDDYFLIVDIHSHGMLPAYFSDTDNEDDTGEVKYAVVVGGVGTHEVGMAFRLCLPGGIFVDLAQWAPPQ